MGARDSNAGDDYHFWWASLKALSLIDPMGSLKALTLEGLVLVDDPDDDFEAVDVAEYHGGMDFRSSSSVVISQLKHSSRHPDKPWTVARLCSGRFRRRPQGAFDKSMLPRRSVVRDLAASYARLSSTYGRDETRSKLQIRLVSNQPMDDVLLAASKEAKEYLEATNGVTLTAALIGQLAGPHSAIIKTLQEHLSGTLKSQDFCEFLRVLDLSDCGHLGRTGLERAVRAQLAELSPESASHSGLALYDLVRRQALPDQPKRTGLRDSDVLASLGVSDIESLYPAPRQLTLVDDPLPAPSRVDLAAAVMNRPGGVVVAHGSAGVGKTTTLTQLRDELPEGSIVLIFDCFGAGQYLNTGEERHSPRRFAMEVINELAQLCGTPMLLHPPSDNEDLWRRLSRTITQSLHAIEPPGRLVICIDAADNAVFAANRRGHRSFLDDLLRIPLPERVTIVATARSHRIESLNVPSAALIELVNFDSATSQRHLQRRFPHVTASQAARFHSITQGNPRVQFYILQRTVSEGWDIEATLDACRSTPEKLFQDLIDSALHVSGGDAGGLRWLALLSALSRPVKIEALRDALEVDQEQVNKFAAGLFPGVKIEDGFIQFRDEDFESYVRTSLKAEDLREAHDKLATMFLQTRLVDADAAAHVADHLLDAGRHSELLALVLEEHWPAAIPDGFRRVEVQETRLDLALRAGASIANGNQAIRLVIRSAETASSKNTLRNLVRDHIELVAQYADSETAVHQYFLEKEHEWLAPFHMTAAAVFARDPAKREKARGQLDSVDAWLLRWQNASEMEKANWRFEPKNLAQVAEAYYRLDGSAAAANWLRRWRPHEFVMEAVAELAQTLGPELDYQAVKEEFESLGLPASYQGPFAACLRPQHQALLPAEWIDEIVCDLLKVPPGEPALWKDRLCEVALLRGNPDLARRLISHFQHPPTSAKWGYVNASDIEGVSALRQRTLLAALENREIDDLEILPHFLLPDNRDRAGHVRDNSGDRAEWLKMVKPLHEICLARIRELRAPGTGNLMSLIRTQIAARNDSANHRWFRVDAVYRAWATLAAESIIDTGGDLSQLDELGNQAKRLLGDQAPWLWLDIAKLLSLRGIEPARASDLCWRAAKYASEEEYSAADRLELTARCAEQAGEVSPELGQVLFGRALEEAATIDDDAARLLLVKAQIAIRGAWDFGPESARVAAALVRSTEEVERHVTESSLVPHSEMLGAIARIDPAYGFVTATRWDDEDRFDLSRAVAPVILSAAETGYLNVSEALCFLHFLEDPSGRVNNTLALLEKLPKDAQRATVIKKTLRNTAKWLRTHVSVTLQTNHAIKLTSWAAENGVQDEIFYAELGPVLRESEDIEAEGYARSSVERRALESTVAHLVQHPAQQPLSKLKANVVTLTEAYVSNEQLASFISGVAAASEPKDRLLVLERVATLAQETAVDSALVLNILAHYLVSWNGWPGISDWAVATIPSFLENNLSSLTWSSQSEPTLSAMRSFGLSDADLRNALLDAIRANRADLSSYQLHNLANLLVDLSSPQEAAEALLSILAPDLKGPHDLIHEMPINAIETIAGTLWSCFGHPTKAVRWRAAHVARDLLLINKPGLAARLINCLSSEGAGPFRDPELFFYALSARVWLLVALQRVAATRPEILSEHAKELMRVATSADLPHAQLRELARNTALGLVAPSDASVLRFANRPAACWAKRSHVSAGDGRSHDLTKRYHFDSMDTLPYWYQPLARVFGVSTKEIAVRAEKWIVDEWAMGSDDWMRDARELRDERSYERTSHRHGSIPPEENLHLYLEYHAMMLAAGELIDEGAPVCVESYEEPGDPWADWLRTHLPGSYHGWLSDLRSPVPTPQTILGNVSSLEDWETLETSDFDAVLGLVARSLSDYPVIASHVDVSRQGAYGSAFVTSALVKPDHAKSLQRALQAAAFANDWKLPDENETGFEIEREPYLLKGWIRDVHDDNGGLDALDPFAEGIRWTATLPGDDFRAKLSCRPDDLATLLRDSRGKIIVWTDRWSDREDQERSYFSGIRSSGVRTFIAKAALLDYLRLSSMSLIVEVQIGRQRDRDTGPHEYKPRVSRIYLIHESGRIEALAT